MEGRFQLIREQHANQMEEMSVTLSNAKLQLSSKEKDYLDLEGKSSQLKDQLRDMTEQSTREIEALKHNYK